MALMRRKRRKRAPRLLLAAAAALLVAGLYVWWGGGGWQPEPLPALGADITQTSVSGLSSGAYMAGQVHLAHSRFVVGAGLVAGGPYACADNPAARRLPWPANVPQNLARALSRCVGARANVPDTDALAARARALAAAGAIDPLDGLAGDRIYLFRGAQDATISPSVVAAARDFYLRAGVAAEAIAVESHPRAAHAFLADGRGGRCGASRPPFLADCGYDQAGAIMAHIYGEPSPPAAQRRGRFVLFDQRPFAAGFANHGLAETGALYLPDDCEARSGCRVHVVFHGCSQGRENVGDAFVQDSGFAAHADTNRIVVLFPQVAASAANPRGCWDWWGYSARDYLGKSAPQIAAVWRMVERLAQPQAP